MSLFITINIYHFSCTFTSDFRIYKVRFKSGNNFIHFIIPSITNFLEIKLFELLHFEINLFYRLIDLDYIDFKIYTL